MVMCFAPDCKHYSEKHGCRFFVFPRDIIEKKRWISLIRRKDREPSAHSLVCGCHFLNCERRNGPTIFEHNKSKRFLDDPFHNKSKGKKLRKQIPPKVDAIPEQDILSDTSENASRRSPVPSTSRRSPERPIEGQKKDFSSTVGSSMDFNFSASLEAENYFLKKELQEASEKLKKLSSSFSYELIRNNDERIQVHTGLPSNEIYMCLFKLMEPYPLTYYQGWTVVNVPKIDQMLLTLMKLKLGLLNEDLAIRFNISSKTVANIFYTWLYALHEIIFKKFMDKIHVERAIRRLKCYKILSLVPTGLIPHASVIYEVCVALKNLQFPLIREVEDLYSGSEEV